MITIRKAEDRGHADFGWLNSRHSFSFGQYHDPKHMGYEHLRVINDDHVAAGAGFGTHPHANMEIISYVLSGSLEHVDSMGNGSIIKSGDVQRMSAGTGVTHSEFNHSKEDEVHFLQIWFLPNAKGLKPCYEQKHFSVDDKKGKLKLVASCDGRNGSVSLNQDVDMYVTILDTNDSVTHNIKDNRKIWVQVAEGTVFLNDIELRLGDGVAVEEEDITLNKANGAEVIIFDMSPNNTE